MSDTQANNIHNASPMVAVSAGGHSTKGAQTTPNNSISAEEPKKKRSFGLKLFDFLLYPLLTNIGVFVISVGATYLTTRGGDKNPDGTLVYGKMGEFFQKRGEWLMGKFEGMGMSRDQAAMGKMVFFSFLDGSLMAPFVKLLEDRREKIGRSLDKTFGTVPDDESVYAAEPKQTWLTVLGGRFATAAIVVPTAVALDKTGLNDKMFINPGLKLGEWLEKQPYKEKVFGNLDVKELAKVSLFEFFYTSVCTAGLYFSSRMLAGLGKKKDEAHKTDTATATPASSTPRTEDTIAARDAHKEEQPARSSEHTENREHHKRNTRPTAGHHSDSSEREHHDGEAASSPATRHSTTAQRSTGPKANEDLKKNREQTIANQHDSHGGKYQAESSTNHPNFASV